MAVDGLIVGTSSPAGEFSDYWTRSRKRLDRELERRVPEIFGPYGGVELGAVLRAVDGGKRIRGCLVLLMCNALGGTAESATLSAVAVECIQAASLMHDDYIDGDRVRRNQPAGWVVDGSRRAVLVGDVMFATVIEWMSEDNPENGALIAGTIANMARGAYIEQSDSMAIAAACEGAPYEYSADRYETIIRLKTAELFAAAGKLGAIAAAAPVALQRNAFEFGICVGEAYQLSDDLEDALKRFDDAVTDKQALVEIAPVMLRFSADTAGGLRSLNSGGFEALRAWVAAQRGVVVERVTETIVSHAARAESLLAPLPDSAFKRMLFEMPAAITRRGLGELQDRP